MPRAGSEKLLWVTTVELGPESSGGIEFREGDDVAVRAYTNSFLLRPLLLMSNIKKPVSDKSLSERLAGRSGQPSSPS